MVSVTSTYSAIIWISHNVLLFEEESCSILWGDHLELALYPSVEHLSCFPIFTAMNNAAVNMGVCMSLQDPAFRSLSEHPAVGLLVHMELSFILRNFHSPCPPPIILPTCTGALVLLWVQL